MLRILLAALLLVPVLAQAQERWVEGTHYERLSEDVRTRDPDKIEVVEVFWYGCIHCFRFGPMMTGWDGKKAEDVDFYRSPAMWNAKMQLHARMFYTADALGRLEELHMPLFSAMNVERKRFDDADEIAEFFAKYGVSDEDFRKAFDSFGVKTAVRQADARARAFRITGTPEVVVAGKYKVSGKYVQNMGEMVEVIDYLVDRERRERAAATTAAVN